MERFVLGGAVRLTAVLEDDLPSGGSVTVDIYNSLGNLVIDGAVTTPITDKIFEYIYQSTDNKIAGEYTVIFNVTVGEYISKSYDSFIFDDITTWGKVYGITR